MVVKVSPAEPLWNRYLFGNTVKNHMLISALKYYLLSIPTVLLGLNFWKIPFLTWEKHILLRTNKGFKFYVGNLMDTWTIKEVVLDNCYKYDSKPKDVIIDIGAGIGDFSIYASDVSTLVYAVEIEREA